LIDKYNDLLDTGWIVTEDDIEADIHALYGGAFDAFMALKL